MKRLLKMTALALGTILFVGLVAVRVYLGTPLFLNTVLLKINQSVPGHIALAGHRLALWKGTVELLEGALTSPAGDTPLTFERLAVTFSWSALLRREVELKRLVISNPRVALIQEQNGQFTLQTALVAESDAKTTVRAQDETALPANVRIRTLQIESGHLMYTNTITPFNASAEAIDASLSMDFGAMSFGISLETGSVRLHLPEVETELRQTRLAAELKNSRLTVSNLEAQMESSTVRISGQVNDVFAQPQLDLRVTGDTRLEDLRALLAIEPEMTGPVQIQMQVQGALSNPHARMSMQYGGGRLGGVLLDGAGLSLDLTERVLTVKSLAVDTAAGRLSAGGTFDAQAVLPGGLLPFVPQWEHLAYEIAIAAEKVDLAKIPVLQKQLRGAAAGQIRIAGRGVTGPMRSATVTVAVDAKGVNSSVMAKSIDARLSCRASVAGDDVRVERLAVFSEPNETTLVVAGTMAGAKQELDLKVDLTVGNLADLLAVAGITGARGAMTLAAEISGGIRHPRVKFTLSGDQLGYDPIRAGAIRCEARLAEDGQLTVSRFDLQQQGGSMQGHGVMRLLTEDGQLAQPISMDLSATFRGLRPDDFWGEAPVTGTFDGEVRLSGSVQRPEAALSMQARNITTVAGQVERAELQVSLAKGVLAIAKLDLTHRQAALQANGRAALLAPEGFKVLEEPRLDLKIVGRRIDIAAFTDAASGTVALDAHLTGSITDPGGTFNVQIDRLAVKGQQLEKVELAAVMGAQKINLAPLRLSGGGSDEITAQGWIAFDRSFALEARSQGFALRKIGLIAASSDVAGEIRFNVAAHGTVTAPVIAGDFHVTHLALKQQPFDDISLQVEVRDQRARLKASQAFDLDADFDLDSGDFTVDAVFERTQLEPYLALVGQADLSGMTTGTFRAQGNVKQLKDATAQVDLALLDLFYDSQKLASARNLTAELTARRFVLAPTTLSLLEQGRLTLGGHGAFDGAIDIAVEGVVPLKAVDPFIAEINDLGGQIRVRAKIAGKSVQPAIDAEITLDNLEGTLPVLLQRLHSLNGKIQLEGAQVTLADISGKIDRGRFDLAGTIGLKGWQPQRADLLFKADQLPFELPAVMNLKTNSRLKIHGDREKAFVEGEIVVLEGLYYKDVNLNPLKGLTEKKRETPVRADRTDIPFFGATILNVAVKRRQPFVVDNNLAYLEISPDLRLEGTPNKPVLSGRAQVDSGEIYYAGNTFVVKRGIVDFLNPYKIEPTLDIHSEVTVRHWLISLLVSGRPDDLKIDLSSQPPEQNADILSLLVAGKTGAELRGGTDTGSMSAKQMMAQLVASTFGEDIKKATGVDLLEVETAGDQTGGSDLIKVTVGKKLSERMTVKYAVSAKQGETVQRAISEYQFMDNFLISGYQETTGVYGGELVFRIEFR